MLLHDLVRTSAFLSETSKRLDKYERLAEFLRRLDPLEVPVGVSYLSGALPQGRIGIGPAAIGGAAPGARRLTPELTLTEVDEALEGIARVSGAGSGAEKVRRLGNLLSRATETERRFLTRLLMGDLRQGALEGIMVEALARATQIPAREVRRAVMVSGNLGAVATAALRQGREGLRPFGIRLFQPVQPMLAQTAENVAEALSRLDVAEFEYKMDGARVQVHKAGQEVRVFTRRLNEVTGAVPEIVEAVRALPARELILDGEVLALRDNGKPHPFQTTMRRFGRKLNVDEMRRGLPLTPFFFDCLWLDGGSLIDQRTDERIEALARAVPEKLLIPRMVTGDENQASSFVQMALDAGHEGVMAKGLDSPYDAGSRGMNWLKLKPAHTLDLVVLAAEWGSGRRRGWLSNLHLGARGPSGNGFVMLGKTFKGMTDRMLVWQTRRLQELEVSRDRWTVYVRPELVVEVAFSDVQASPHYPGGMALRFARVKRYRLDKTAEQADTIDAVRVIYQAASGS